MKGPCEVGRGCQGRGRAGVSQARHAFGLMRRDRHAPIVKLPPAAFFRGSIQGRPRSGRYPRALDE